MSRIDDLVASTDGRGMIAVQRNPENAHDVHRAYVDRQQAATVPLEPAATGGRCRRDWSTCTRWRRTSRWTSGHATAGREGLAMVALHLPARAQPRRRFRRAGALAPPRLRHGPPMTGTHQFVDLQCPYCGEWIDVAWIRRWTC
ncbi:hypothetical protein [Pantoea ananatis]|uniref:hypothetical protein n=1 Tax=Pantoea ananas TaxID=553 RepID=UPI0039B96E1F